MVDASRDQNHITGKLGVWCVDGTTTIPIKCDETTGEIMLDTISTISYTPVPIAPHDANWAKVWLFEGQDGLTYPCNVNASGELLVDY